MYTEKQKEVLKLFKEKQFKRLNILQGSVRSGKTWISLIIWSFWVASQPQNKQFLMVAKTLTSLKRNCLDLLQQLIGESNFHYSLSQKEAHLFGRLIYLEGVNDARAENKIRGMTLQGAYCDELSLFTEDFFAMLLSRLSERGAKLFGTTNPDTPRHWLKEKYLDNEKLDLLNIFFHIDDNTTLEGEYIQRLKDEYGSSPVFYNRFILGLWVNAEGLIYPSFTNDYKSYLMPKEEAKQQVLTKVIIGLDFGGERSDDALVAIGIVGNYKEIIVLKSHKFKGNTDPSFLENEVKLFTQMVIDDYGKVNLMYCDSAETHLINGIRKNITNNFKNIIVAKAKKIEIANRIKFFLRISNLKRIKFVENDTKTIVEALSTCVYDEKSFKDKRLDNGTTDIDSLDAFEYTYERYITLFIKD